MTNSKSERRYRIKVINCDGVACVSVVGTGNPYNTGNKREPKGKTYGTFKDKYYKRGTILRNLGIWGNGQI